jgi:general secretion pathway protein J
MKKSNALFLKNGFTLLEIMIALFIFTLLSMILVGALRNIIDSVAGTENKAERLRKLQMTLLMMSRDIEQTVNRPIINNSGKFDPAFIGSAHRFVFTHAGMARSSHTQAQSVLQRTAYQWDNYQLVRLIWQVLDQPPKSQPLSRILLAEVSEAHFEYLDKNGRFYNEWPLNGQGSDAPLPQGIRIYLTFAKWGTMTQLYLIPVKIDSTIKPPGPPDAALPSGTATPS